MYNFFRIEHTKNGDNMINYYKKSIKVFKNYIKQNPYATKEEWDKYAQDNNLFSSQTLMFHLFHEDLVKYLNKKQIEKFEYLKNMFLIIPIKYRDMKTFKTLIKITNSNKEARIKERN